MRPKVLVLIKGLGLGGAERLLVDSIPFMNREQFDYHVGYLLPWKHFLVWELEGAGIPVHCLGGASVGDDEAIGDPLVPGRRRRCCRVPCGGSWPFTQRERFDLIQADLPIAGILARLMGRWTAVPVVYTEHNLQERYHSLTRWANAATYPAGTEGCWRCPRRSLGRSNALACFGAHVS